MLSTQSNPTQIAIGGMCYSIMVLCIQFQVLSLIITLFFYPVVVILFIQLAPVNFLFPNLPYIFNHHLTEHLQATFHPYTTSLTCLWVYRCSNFIKFLVLFYLSPGSLFTSFHLICVSVIRLKWIATGNLRDIFLILPSALLGVAWGTVWNRFPSGRWEKPIIAFEPSNNWVVLQSWARFKSAFKWCPCWGAHLSNSVQEQERSRVPFA